MKVTILLSVYNGEKMLRRALDSISAQTYKNIELYLVDHGSGDSTLKIIEEFKCNFPCYKRHYDRIPEDKKYNASRVGKIILSEVESDLFYWFSHDDIMHKDFILNNIIQYLNCPNMKIWQSAIWWFDANVGINMRKEKPYMYSYNNMESLKRKMIERSIVNCPSVFFSTEMIKEIGVSEPEYMNCGDYEMFLRIIDNDYFIYPIRKFLGLFYGIGSLNQCSGLININKDGYQEKLLQEKYKEKWGINNVI